MGRPRTSIRSPSRPLRVFMCFPSRLLCEIISTSGSKPTAVLKRTESPPNSLSPEMDILALQGPSTLDTTPGIAPTPSAHISNTPFLDMASSPTIPMPHPIETVPDALSSGAPGHQGSCYATQPSTLDDAQRLKLNDSASRSGPLSPTLDAVEATLPLVILPDTPSPIESPSPNPQAPSDVFQPIVNSVDLPPRPDNVCVRCWEGVVAARFGLWLDPVEKVRDGAGHERWTGGYEYTVAEADWIICRDSLCCWGVIIRGSSAYRSSQPLRFGTWHFRVGTPEQLSSGDVARKLVIVVNDGRHSRTSLYAHIDDPAAAWVWDRTRNPIVWRSDVLDMAKSLIADCVQNHERCQVFSDLDESTTLPTRLVDCTDPLRPRLIETKDWDSHARYIALSYVWGQDQPHRTTQRNLTSYLKAIDLSLLPQTIRDAVNVTHALGIQFLWLDSLCIIQDSLEDKHRELAKMRDVYLRAFLTIDAANASSVSQGFLHDGLPLDGSEAVPLICPRRSAEEVLQVGSVYVANGGHNNRNINPWAPPRPSYYGHTAYRAWCLQEVLLSRRCLLFTHMHLQFRCHSTTSHVGGPHGRFHDNDGDLPAHPPVTIFKPPTSPILFGSRDWMDVHHSWHKVVEDYMRRRLSYPSDRLLACAGLAELFGRTLRCEYLAGLWRESLLYDLLWYTEDEGDGLGTDPRAPSWSWAAQNGAKYDYSSAVLRTLRQNFQDGSGRLEVNAEELAEIGECAVTLETPTLPFGPVTDGCLTLRTPLLGPYKLRIESDRRSGDCRPVLVSMVDVLRDTEGVQRDSTHADDVVDHETQSYCPELPIRPYKPFVDKAYKPVAEGEICDLWLAPLIYTGHHSGFYEQGPHLECLILTPIEPGTGVYRRVGYRRLDASSRGEVRSAAEWLRGKIDGKWSFPRAEIKLI
ncbi:heterokaryon incompatibility protein-domain-containing protein [Cubamyces lactineus]|nr:heterokaryon incompatibility protein-domain-containing protein [Cubamyces lactineus]